MHNPVLSHVLQLSYNSKQSSQVMIFASLFSFLKVSLFKIIYIFFKIQLSGQSQPVLLLTMIKGYSHSKQTVFVKHLEH